MMKKPHSSRVRFFIFFSLVFLFLLSVVTIQAATPELVGTSLVADIAETSSPAVVWITTTFENKNVMINPYNPFGGFGDEPEQSEGLGSGFFIDEEGHILTNYHVVHGADRIEVTTLTDPKNPLLAKLIGEDKDMDVAIIKVDLPVKTKMPYLKLGDSDKARVGEWVIAIGNPFGLDHTVTLGIISAKGRPLFAGKDNNLYEDMIQTDAAINPGNSGGPLLNLQGEVIGINTAVSTSGQGLGFAIPINAVRDVLHELKTKGKLSRVALGIQMQDVRTLNLQTKSYLGITKNEGVLIVRVTRDGAAAKAGLRNYDVILEINHQPINAGEDLIKLLRKQKVGNKVNLLILRQKELMTVEVTLEEKKE